jgi:hypothetical protein
MDAVFQIKWKSGDITWLPYYQITHLQALADYLELFGKSDIKQLPKGTGEPPQDPQLFLGTSTLVPGTNFFRPSTCSSTHFHPEEPRPFFL